MKNVLVELRGNLCNQLIEIGAAIVDLQKSGIYDYCLYFSFNHNTKIQYIAEGTKQILDYNHINYSLDKLDTSTIYNIYTGYKQEYKYFDDNIFRSIYKCPESIKSTIYNLYPDIEDSVVCHIRRGDYFDIEHKGCYYAVSQPYVKKVYDKYFSNRKLIIISNDIEWCKENLTGITNNIVFAENTTPLIDFYSLTFSYGNICSGSTFSVIGSILNKNDNAKFVMHKPFDRKWQMDDMPLVPSYFIKEDITKDMEEIVVCEN